MIKLSFILTLLLPLVLSQPPCQLKYQSPILTISNGYTLMHINLQKHAVTHLYGDYHGSLDPHSVTDFKNLLFERNGFFLSRMSSSYQSYTSLDENKAMLTFEVVVNKTDAVSVVVSGVTDQALSPNVAMQWVVSVGKGERRIEFTATAMTLKAVENVNALFFGIEFDLDSTYGLFEDGPVQMMNSISPYFGSRVPLERFYAIGGGSVDITIQKTDTEFMMLKSGNFDAKSALYFVYVGDLGEKMESWETIPWRVGSGFGDSGHRFHIPANRVFNISILISPNNFDFPIGDIPTDESKLLPFEAVQSIYTGIYGSPIGAIVSHIYAPEGRIQPCINFPEGCYQGNWNFFDPDTFLSISALVIPDNPYINQQIKKIIDTTGRLICPHDTDAICLKGQIPHHIVENCKDQLRCRCSSTGTCVTYDALSGATQTGPNIFWILSVLKYASSTGDYTWLASVKGSLDLAMDFILQFYDSAYLMINAPGPLWIDTFIRYGFTSDTNSAVVHLLEKMIELEIHFNNENKAKQYSTVRYQIITSMNKYLWHEDHFITQMDISENKRDFWDYDSNLLSIFFNVSTVEQSQKFLKKMDSGYPNAGTCVHARGGTWVSGIYYDEDDCHVQNTGDSQVLMGRIAWADAGARHRLRDLESLNMILEPLVIDLSQNTWMYERYSCTALPTHNNFYIEYPEVIAMIISQFKYGLDISLDKIVINPLIKSEKGSIDFHYHLGRFHIDYSSTKDIMINIPLVGEKKYELPHLKSTTRYTITTINTLSSKNTTQTITSTNSGLLTFSSESGTNFRIIISN